MAVHPRARGLGKSPGRTTPFDIEELVKRFGNEWLATARRNANSAADAEDAYQRGIEILLTKPPATDEPEEIAAWTHTVVRNEALQGVRRRKQLVDTEFEEIAERLAGDAGSLDERAIESERLGHGREALARLSPDQTRCLLLRADGLGYPEICELTGFSYAKVNRCLSDGRKAFIARVGLIESGAECARLFPVLSMYTDNEASPQQRADVELHLRHCAACRATLRDLRTAPESVAALLPVGVAFASAGGGMLDRVFGWLQSAYEWIYARVAGSGAAGGHGVEVATAKKAAAAAALVAALAGSGALVEHAITQGGGHAAFAPAHAARASRNTSPERPAARQRAARRDAARAGRASSSAERALLDRKASASDGGGASARDTQTADSTAAADPNDRIPASTPNDVGHAVGGLGP